MNLDNADMEDKYGSMDIVDEIRIEMQHESGVRIPPNPKLIDRLIDALEHERKKCAQITAELEHTSSELGIAEADLYNVQQAINEYCKDSCGMADESCWCCYLGGARPGGAKKPK